MAQYTGKSGFTVPRPIIIKNGVNDGVITATPIQLTQQSSTVQILSNATGATQDVKLPAVKNGLQYWVANKATSTGAVSVNLQSGTLVGSVAAGAAGWYVSDGVNWLEVING